MARVLSMLFAFTFCGAALLQAQSADGPFYAAIDVAATLGHTSDKAIGGEAGYRLTPRFDVFFEGGHIGNAASADLDQRATTIGNAVGASASAVAKVNYFDFGARYLLPNLFPQHQRILPYVTAGIGAAHVKNETTLSVNGVAVDPASVGVQFGNDLSGSVTSGYFMLGGGATMPFGKRYFADLSYRYGRVFQKKDSAGNVVLSGINTNRVQIGAGVKF